MRTEAVLPAAAGGRKAVGRTLVAVVSAVGLFSAGCGEDSPRLSAPDRLELTDGRSIRLGQPAEAIAPSLLPMQDTAWLTDARHGLYVGTQAGHVVAIVAKESATDFPIPGYGFGVAFDVLQESSDAFTPGLIGGRPGVVLAGPHSRMYALSVPDASSCEDLPRVRQVAVVAHGYEPMVAALLDGQKCVVPVRTPPPPPPPAPISIITREVDGNLEIFRRDNRTLIATRLTYNPAEDSHPSVLYSENSRIVFQSNRDGNYEIYVMDGDGSNQTRVTSNTDDDFNPDWSPDQRSIVFVNSRDGDRDIYVMRADGANLRRLTDSPRVDDSPAWASNVRMHGGTDIAFHSNRDGNYEIYVMKPDGLEVRRLTDNRDLDYSPAWSPDGTRIAFVSNRDDNTDIYVMNADGSEQVRLTDAPGDDTAPLWSVDGKRINFSSNRDGDTARYSMAADGSGQVRTDAVP